MKHLFYDELMRSPVFDPETKKLLQTIPIVNCRNIGDYYFMESDQEVWDMGDFPCPLSPFPLVWLDFTRPDKIVSETHGELAWSGFNHGDAPERWGFLIQTIDLSLGKNKLSLLQQWHEFASEIAPYLPRARWCSIHYLFVRFPNEPTKKAYWLWRFFHDEQGDVLPLEGSPDQHFVLMGECDDPLTHHLDNVERERGYEAMLQEKYAYYEGIVPLWHTALLSLSFMNCKNIRLVDVHPPAVVPHTRAQKKRGERPWQPVDYKVLTIATVKEVIGGIQSAEQVGTKEALSRAKVRGHFVRGSWATYTEQAPLFGKYTGRYYRPMHRRGDEAVGRVEKDYRMGETHQRPSKRER